MSASHRLGKYSVVYRLGIGGMAEVFKCRLSGIGGFNKWVVVKRIRPELAHDPSFVAMFLDEARIVANLSHPNIVQIFEIDEFNGAPYIAMEYVRGPTLGLIIRQERVRRRPNRALAARLMAGICSGLHYAHRFVDDRGTPLSIVHRDVSPQNVIVSMEGVPKLLDFGVAKARGQIAHTGAGSLKGKLKFMAPEQFVPGEKVTPAVDVFAAGVCLYQATTLALPYGGDTELDIMRAAASGQFAKPSELVPGFCPKLEQIILWAMAPKLVDRCPDALTLQQALEEYADHERFTQSDLAQKLAELFPAPAEQAEPSEAYCDIESKDIVGPAEASAAAAPQAWSEPRITLSLRAAASTAEASAAMSSAPTVPALPSVTPDPVPVSAPRPHTVAKAAGIDVELNFDDEVSPKASRAPVWGAALAVALMGVFALAVGISRPKRAAVSTLGESVTPLVVGRSTDEPRVERAAPSLLAVVDPPKVTPTPPLAQPSLASAGRFDERLNEAKRELKRGRYVEATKLARAVLAEQLDEPSAKALLLEATERERAARAAVAMKSAPPALAPSKGSVRIESEPPAQVFFNGKSLGWSPVRTVPIAPGSYTVRVEHVLRQPVEREVKVVAGKEVSLLVELPELPKPAVAVPLPPEPEPLPRGDEPSSLDGAPHESSVITPVAKASVVTPSAVRTDREPTEATLLGSAPSTAVRIDCPDGAKAVRKPLEAWCEGADGVRDGPYLRLWANGLKALEGEYRRGKKHGRWLEFYEGGGERARVDWRRGVQVW